MAAHTILPVLGVPMESAALKGLDSLLSTVQMPGGIPVATVAIGGGRNAGLLAVSIVALDDARDRGTRAAGQRHGDQQSAVGETGRLGQQPGLGAG